MNKTKPPFSWGQENGGEGCAGLEGRDGGGTGVEVAEHPGELAGEGAHDFHPCFISQVCFLVLGS